MKHCNNCLKMFRAAALVLLLAAAFGACTKVDDTLGSNLVPENQQMKAGTLALPRIDGDFSPKKYVETRLFLTDSIVASNISSGYFGSQLHDTLGLRSAGFLSQMVSYYAVPDKYFGYKPIFDSAQLLLSISAYGSDTLTEQTFAVYEILSNAYLTEKPVQAGKTERDSVFYTGFDPLDPNGNHDPSQRVYDPQKKLFTFRLGGDRGPATKAVTLTPTPYGREYVNRLMLQEGKYKEDYTIYAADSLKYFLEEFKGLYICPDPDAPLTEYGKGSIFATTLESSGLAVYGRNRLESDPTLIKDTVGLEFYFYDKYVDHGNVSVNVIRHDYEKYNPASADAHIVAADAEERNTSRPENPRVYVEGMGGVVTELTFAEPFFAELEAALDAEYAQSGKRFETLAFSQVRMFVYFPGSDYDWQAIDPLASVRLIEEMDAAPGRLGLYTDFKRLAAVSDYNYITEKQYSMELAYGGKINRSRGCYIMDITSHVQQMWNSYLEEKRAAADEGRAVDLDNVAKRTVYLAPEAYDLYTPSFGILQGAATDDASAVKNNAPIRFSITYNMIK